MKRLLLSVSAMVCFFDGVAHRQEMSTQFYKFESNGNPIIRHMYR